MTQTPPSFRSAEPPPTPGALPVTSPPSSTRPAASDLNTRLLTEQLPVTASDPTIVVPIRVEVRVTDTSAAAFESFALATLNDPRGWSAAGFRFRSDRKAALRLVLAEPLEVDRLCAPLETVGKVSCQNGVVVAINAERWRFAVPHWTADLDSYRQYLVNHEVGHAFGMRHPTRGCSAPLRPSAVMATQTGSLGVCAPGGFPRAWEIRLASIRPAYLAPPPAWNPGVSLSPPPDA